jgi:peptidoglycan/LPS O-acetylase OafA/YrhL
VVAYRKDIDGLRAVAILAVVLYHYGVLNVSGGFVGVDIFFVISGFVITSLLIAEIEDERFSLIGFYERRLRRILPALFVLILIVSLIAIFVLPPRALTELANSVVATSLFSSNVYFWNANRGYFEGPSEISPLLHTWSLAVEEQFYIAFPILLLLALRVSRRFAASLILGIVVVSFALSVWASVNAPTANFYLAPTRIWELLLGAALAFHQSSFEPWGRPQSEIACAIGVLLIAFALLMFSSTTPVPGLAALAPCLGAALLIYGGRNPDSTMTRLLSARPLVAIGLISYSLYLWHWPIFVLLRHYVFWEPLTLSVTLSAIVVSFALAILSWRFIERPIRERRVLSSSSSIFTIGAIATALLLVLGGAGLATKGLPSRYSHLSEVAMQRDEAPSGSSLPRECVVLEHNTDATFCSLTNGPAGSRRVLLWGDSFAAHYIPGFVELGNSIPLSAFAYTFSGCPPILGYAQMSNAPCTSFNDRLLEIVASNKIDTIVLSARWNTYLDSRKLALAQIANTVSALQARGLTVIVIGQSPTFYFNDPEDYLLVRMQDGGSYRTARAWAAVGPELNDALRQATGKAIFLDPSAVLCLGRSCSIREDGNYTVRDDGHLTAYGSRKVIEQMGLLQVLQTPAPTRKED